MQLNVSNQKRLTVLLIDSDGFSDYTCYLARGLTKYLDVILYSFSEHSYKITGAAMENKIRFRYFKKLLPKGYSAIKGVIRVILLFFILSHMLIWNKYDIVHIQDYLPTFFLFIPFLKLRKKQVCWTIHDLEIFNLSQGIVGKLQVLFLRLVCQPVFLTKYVDKIFVHAQSLKESLVLKNINQNRIDVIKFFDYQYLVELNEMHAQIKSDISSSKAGYILFIGNIAPWKGIDTLVNATRIVRNKIEQDFTLVIAGTPYEGLRDVPFFENINQEDYKYIKIFDRYITQSEIPLLLKNAKFIVLPYNYLFAQSASGVITLAYTFAKPVIVSNLPSLTEYVDDGRTGLIYKVNDSEQLAKCMIELICNDEKCIQMGQKAHQKLIKEMSLDSCCHSTFNAYTRI